MVVACEFVLTASLRFRPRAYVSRTGRLSYNINHITQFVRPRCDLAL